MIRMDTDPDAPQRVKTCMFLMAPALAWIELCHYLTACSAKFIIRTVPKGQSLDDYDLYQ